MVQLFGPVSECHGYRLKNYFYLLTFEGRRAFFGYAYFTPLRSYRAPAQALKFNHQCFSRVLAVPGTILALAS